MGRFRVLVGAAAAVAVGLAALTGCGDDGPAEPKPLSEQQGGGEKANEQPAERGSNDDATPSSTPSKSAANEPSKGESGEDKSGKDNDSGSQKKVTDSDDLPQGPKVEKAKSVVGDYFEELNKAVATGDVSGVSKLATSSCESCESAKDNITKVYSKGGTIEGGKAPHPNIGPAPNEGPASTVTISATAQVAEEKILDSDGDEVDSSPAEESVFIYEVDPSAGKIVKGRVQ